jgi:hypothetical protein
MVVDIVVQSGVELPEPIALMDLHYWIDRQQLKPYRYYASRWRWGTKRVYLLFRRIGVYGGGEQEGAKGEQEGANREQYDTSYRSSSDRGKKSRATEDDHRLAELLYSRILENDPQAKQPNLATWAEDINRCHRLDKRTYGDIEEMIEWCQADSFWSCNILSGAKFRQQFPKLLLQSVRKRNTSNGAHTRSLEPARQGSANGRPSAYSVVAEQVADELERKRRQRGDGPDSTNNERNGGRILPLAVDRDTDPRG